MTDANREVNNHHVHAQARALTLFCLLAAAFVLNNTSLWATPNGDLLTAARQVSLLAHLSLKESAVGRPHRQVSNLEKKASRGLGWLTLLSGADELALFYYCYNQLSALDGRHLYSLTTISPPSDRAPPPAVL